MFESVQNAASLVSGVNDEVAAWGPRELASLDPHCRPTRVRDVNDIAHWRDVLTRAYCAGGALGSRPDQYRRMLGIFTAACHRARELGLLASVTA